MVNSKKKSVPIFLAFADDNLLFDNNKMAGELTNSLAAIK